MADHTRILIVDDEPIGRETLSSFLFDMGHQLSFAADGPEALRLARSELPDLVLLDVMMPGMDGCEVCRQLRADPVMADLPVVITTALDDRESKLRAIDAGADDFITKPVNRLELRARVAAVLRLNRFRKLLAQQRDLREAHERLQHAYDQTLEGWVRALDLRDSETESHSQRVADMTVRLCRDAGMTEEQLRWVRIGALLHDIGKIGVPDHILRKAGPLTDEEWAIMRRHPEAAFRMLEKITYLAPALAIPYCHHEKWDGTGYPRGLKGEEIPLEARIFAVVDVDDALRSARPYRAAWAPERVREYIRASAGTHFDPQAVELYLSTVR